MGLAAAVVFASSFYIIKLESSRAPGAMALASRALLVSDVRLRVGVGQACRASEVLLRLSLLGSAQEHGVGALGVSQHQLVESQAFPARLHDPRTSSLREAQSAHAHLRDLEQTLVVHNSPDNDCSLVTKQ